MVVYVKATWLHQATLLLFKMILTFSLEGKFLQALLFNYILSTCTVIYFVSSTQSTCIYRGDFFGFLFTNKTGDVNGLRHVAISGITSCIFQECRQHEVGGVKLQLLQSNLYRVQFHIANNREKGRCESAVYIYIYSTPYHVFPAARHQVDLQKADL